MEYITTKEASAKWGISSTRITILANEGRIPGAYRCGKSWLIPASAIKPEPRKPSRGPHTKGDNFSFPLYPLRSDWSAAMEGQLSAQQRRLLHAQIALQECRFRDAYLQLEAIVRAPEDRSTEIGALWSAGMCCIALNKPEDFSGIYLRLQMLLAEDFPHRDDLAVTLDFLKTYVDTISFAAKRKAYNTDIHPQCLPTTCVLVGYAQLATEAIAPDTADVSLLELNLRFLEYTGAFFAAELVHLYLLGIYALRQDNAKAEKHAKAVVQIAFEMKLYFPLVTYYSYNIPIFSAILKGYPEEFRNLCLALSRQYANNYAAFTASLSKDSVFSRLTDEDYPYVFCVFMGLPNARIAQKLSVSQQTVKHRLDKLCEKLGMDSKKELRDYLHHFL